VELRVVSGEFKVSKKFWGLQIINTRFKIQDSRFKTQDSKLKIQGNYSGILPHGSINSPCKGHRERRDMEKFAKQTHFAEKNVPYNGITVLNAQKPSSVTSVISVAE